MCLVISYFYNAEDNTIGITTLFESGPSIICLNRLAYEGWNAIHDGISVFSFDF